MVEYDRENLSEQQLIYLFRIQMKIDTARRGVNSLNNLQRAPNETEKLSNDENKKFQRARLAWNHIGMTKNSN